MLTRERIVDAAVALVERNGPDALSMRAVANELGVAVMSLYNHVPNKAALLKGIAERVMADLDLPEDGHLDWRARARELIRAFRRVARENPRCTDLIVTHSVEVPFGLQPVERGLAIAHDAGFDGPTSVRLMRAIISYAQGSLLRETEQAKMLYHLPADAAGAFADLDPARFPRVMSLAKELTEHDAESDFEFGLDLFINAIDALPR
ncbi:TetR family transcriptional regulator [Actinocorallia herbida]|uniref:TetR family transcriptional regulator n=1 Tax=Actinocorallia herbida TaxID=58109 RepID=A0A3N1CTN4_9ACTN|nr:TetR/AcrR family transcriptional regulator C-terminal domain-containing protein [Actinocorallia herbida]ROO84585.1 TetR family transcriptional regulator [Actinocorallia herbida]